MSFGEQQAYPFLGPLRGKTATFLVDSRQVNLSFAKTIVSLTVMTTSDCAIFDIDALYSSNSDEILSGLSLSAARSIHVFVPEPGSSIETELSGLFRALSGVIIVDSLNTLHHLFSSSGVSSRSRKLAFAMASLSYLARTSGKAVLFTMYRREKTMRSGGGKSISDLSDTTISVKGNGSGLLMKCERGTAWPAGMFSLRIT
ncbi:MAG: hypothetical protein ABSB26_02830 [Nitrososphaerales archaeon]|jgi:hypothetical protein